MNFNPTDQDIVVNADQLTEFASQLYQKAGVPTGDADASARLQVSTDLRGIHSHGTRALPAEGFDRVYFPGEIEAMKQEKWSKEGIPLHREHLKGLADLAKELGVEVFWQV